MTKPEPLDLKFEEILKIVERKDIGDFRKAHEIEKVIKQRIKQACEFYLRYKDNPTLFVKEIKDEKILLELVDLIGNKEYFILNGWIIDYEFRGKYNEWLFKFAFKDVLEEG